MDAIDLISSIQLGIQELKIEEIKYLMDRRIRLNRLVDDLRNLKSYLNSNGVIDTNSVDSRLSECYSQLTVIENEFNKFK